MVVDVDAPPSSTAWIWSQREDVMTIHANAAALLGVDVAAMCGGESLGRVDHVYAEQRTGEPKWVALHTGPFGTHVSLVPISAFSWTSTGKTLTVSLNRGVIGRAPHHDPWVEITAADERELTSYYQLPSNPAAMDH
jgi:hypothetical protein